MGNSPSIVSDERVCRSTEFRERPAGSTTFLLLSDTHMRHGSIPAEKLPADPDIVLLHAGDFTMNGSADEIREFNDWLGTLPYRHKIVIGGNHDRFLDARFHELRERGQLSGRNSKGRVEPEQLDAVSPSADSLAGCQAVRSLLTNCVYLENSATTVNGISIYGTPSQPNRQRVHSGFTYASQDTLDDHYARIPSGVDVLVTHGPPLSIGDRNVFGHNVGCSALRSVVLHRVRPQFHVFGHIHTDCGVFQEADTIFINGSICSAVYIASHDPFLFHVRPRSS